MSASALPSRTQPRTQPRATSRRERPAGSTEGVQAPFEALDHAHQRVLQVLTAFDGLLDLLEAQGPTGEAARRAGEIHAFFEGHARQHHADEERLVFPGLLASGNATLVHEVLRLQQDHGWLEEDWRLLAPQLEAIARGYNWYDLPMLRLALPVFRELYEDHIALEESLIYPAAKQRQALLDAGAQARR